MGTKMPIQIPTSNIIEIEHYFFNNGGCVLSASKDYKPSLVCDIPNMYVFRVMLPLVSKNWATVVKSNTYYYYTITATGIQALREKYGLPDSVTPRTHVVSSVK